MDRTTILIPPELRRRLADEARRRRVPQSELIRDALTRYLSEGEAEPPRLVGSAEVEGLEAREVKSWVRREWARKARAE